MKFKVLITQIILVISFIMSWQILANTGLINSFIFSSPTKIITTTYDLLINAKLIYHIYITLNETIIAFLLGIIISFLVSIIMYEFRFIGNVLEPFLTIINSLPKVALGPMIIIWFGANTKSIIVMALLINVIVSIITIYTSFVNTDKDYIFLFKTFNATKLDILTKLIIKINYPTMVASFKINIAMTLIGVIMGEFLVSKAGLGYLIIYGMQIFNLNIVISGIIILIGLSYILYYLVNNLNKWLIKR